MNNQQVFLALLRAGLWGDVKGDGFSQNDFDSAELKAVPKGQADGLKVIDLPAAIDYDEVLRLSGDQSVVGLVTAGLEMLPTGILPLTEKLKLVGMCQLIEQRNIAMNSFIARTIVQMRVAGIEPLLVKGQGIAQCYTRPLWRTSGDIDFFFSPDVFPKAVDFFMSYAANKVQDAKYTKSVGVYAEDWFVELHGTLRSSLSTKVDKEIDAVQKEVFSKREYKVWHNNGTDVYMPDVNSDLFLLFTHFVRHFYKGGIVIRQLCDWCRFLWIYRNKVDSQLLVTRLRRAGLVDEWKSFSAFVVEYLGMPVEAMLLYDVDERWNKKGEKVLEIILTDSQPKKMHYILSIARVFPQNTFRFLPTLLLNVNRLKIKERLIV